MLIAEFLGKEENESTTHTENHIQIVIEYKKKSLIKKGKET